MNETLKRENKEFAEKMLRLTQQLNNFNDQTDALGKEKQKNRSLNEEIMRVTLKLEATSTQLHTKERKLAEMEKDSARIR